MLYSNRLREGMVASVMKMSGHLTTTAMFSMVGLTFFSWYILLNVQFLLSQPHSGIFLIFIFITLSNLLSLNVHCRQFYQKKITNFFYNQQPLRNSKRTNLNQSDFDKFWAVPGRKFKKLQRATEILVVENIEEGETDGKGM